MPPIKRSNFENWARLDKNLAVDENSLFCKVCSKQIHVTKKYHVTQHLSSGIHVRNLKNKNSQPLLKTVVENNSTTGPALSQFSYKLCEAFVTAGIPLKKLNNSVLKEFLADTTKQLIPDESTLRKNYLNKCYESKIKNIKSDIGDNYIWTSLDETTDSKGRYIANLIIGKLCEKEHGTPHLLASKQLERTNHKTIANFFDDSLKILFPEGIKKDKILLFVSDAAPYMVKAAQILQIFYDKMVHLTCLDHGLHRVCEYIREEFSVVNSLLSSTKKVFLKTPLRVAVYQEMLPDTPLPPEPVLTRWGTWISACVFYATYFDKIKEVVNSFDASSAQAISKSQKALNNAKVKSGLMFIKSNYAFLPKAIERLEKRGLSLVESMELFNNVQAQLEKVDGHFGKKILEKHYSVVNKNPGLQVMLETAKVLEGNVSTMDLYMERTVKFKYAPVTSCEVERSFSRYKEILSDRRQNLLPGNIEKYLVVSWENNVHRL